MAVDKTDVAFFGLFGVLIGIIIGVFLGSIGDEEKHRNLQDCAITCEKQFPNQKIMKARPTKEGACVCEMSGSVR